MTVRNNAVTSFSKTSCLTWIKVILFFLHPMINQIHKTILDVSTNLSNQNPCRHYDSLVVADWLSLLSALACLKILAPWSLGGTFRHYIKAGGHYSDMHSCVFPEEKDLDQAKFSVSAVFHMVDFVTLLLFSILANTSVVGLLSGHMIRPGLVCTRPCFCNFVIELVITHFSFAQDVLPLLSGTFGLSVHWGGVGTVAALSLLSMWWLDWFPRICHGNYCLSTDTQLGLFCRFFRHWFELHLESWGTEPAVLKTAGKPSGITDTYISSKNNKVAFSPAILQMNLYPLLICSLPDCNKQNKKKTKK